MPIKIALVDDHRLFRKAMVSLIESDAKYEVLFEAGSGKELFENIKAFGEPEIVLLDISMRGQDGFTVAAKLRKDYPAIRFIAVTMNDQEDAIIKMIKLGARGYVLKGEDPEGFFACLEDVYTKGYYYSEFVAKTMASTINYHSKWDAQTTKVAKLTQREITFLEHVCNDLSYKEIATLMSVSVRTVDGYRDSLFQKINVRTRVGLVIYAIKHGIIRI